MQNITPKPAKKFIAIAISAALLSASAHASQQLRIIDGDTIEIDGDRHRLLDIDAPELSQTCMDGLKKWKCGKASKANLGRIIRGRHVLCETRARDYYKRKLSTCYVASGFDEWINLNARMVELGWAIPYRGKSKYESQSARAEENNAGIWRGYFVDPYKWRRSGR